MLCPKRSKCSCSGSSDKCETERRAAWRPRGRVGMRLPARQGQYQSRSPTERPRSVTLSPPGRAKSAVSPRRRVQLTPMYGAILRRISWRSRNPSCRSVNPCRCRARSPTRRRSSSQCAAAGSSAASVRPLEDRGSAVRLEIGLTLSTAALKCTRDGYAEGIAHGDCCTHRLRRKSRRSPSEASVFAMDLGACAADGFDSLSRVRERAGVRARPLMSRRCCHEQHDGAQLGRGRSDA
jgi:hypothetical protein